MGQFILQYCVLWTTNLNLWHENRKGAIRLIWFIQHQVQGRIQKIFEGSSFGGEAHLPLSGLPRKRRSLGESGGMPPENFWKYGCSEVQFGAFLSRNRIATALTISQTTLALSSILHCCCIAAALHVAILVPGRPEINPQPSHVLFAHARAHILRTRLPGPRPLRCRNAAHSYSSIERLR